MANSNVLIVSCPRSGTHKLGTFFSESGYFYLREAYTHLYQNKNRPFIPDPAIDNWLNNMVKSSPVPVCLKVWLSQIYSPTLRVALTDKQLLNKFSNTVYLYRKNGLDIASSQTLARAKNVWTANADLKKDKIYLKPIQASEEDFDNALKEVFEQWYDFVTIPTHKTENEIWITYEDDIPSLKIDETENTEMPDKKSIISNWKNLEDIYNSKWAKKYNDLTEEIERRRSKTTNQWKALKAQTLILNSQTLKSLNALSFKKP